MAGPIAARFLISTAIAGLLGRCVPAVTTTELDLLPACSCSGCAGQSGSCGRNGFDAARGAGTGLRFKTGTSCC